MPDLVEENVVQIEDPANLEGDVTVAFHKGQVAPLVGYFWQVDEFAIR